MNHGWFINTVFWIHCEIYKTNGKICPLRNSTPGDEYFESSRKRIRVRHMAGCTMGRAWQRWGDGSQRHIWSRKLALCLSVCSASLIDARRTVPHAHKGLVTNWPHHSSIQLVTVVYFAYIVITAMEILSVNKRVQLASKARLLTEADVDGGKVQEMAEDDGNVDDAVFHRDPVVPEEKCV